jgi:hypothetical protein
MGFFDSILIPLQERRQADAARWAEMDSALCMLCHAHGADKRTLFLSCFYQLPEVIPEIIDLFDLGEPLKDKGYALRICKSCRGDFLGMLKEWRDRRLARRPLPKDHDGEEVYAVEDADRNIPYRTHGRTEMMTRSEYDQRVEGPHE